MQFCDGTNWIAMKGGGSSSSGTTPSGAVMAFDLTACPSGWSEYTLAYGRFIRGIDKSGGTIDPDGARTVGNIQEDAIRNITGTLLLSNPNQTGTGAFTASYANVGDANTWAHRPGVRATFDASNVVPTADENRPKNVALLYCRKN